MDYTIKLLEEVRHRYLLHVGLNSPKSSKKLTKFPALLDTGAFNSMIDLSIAKHYAIMLPIKMPISIGGNLGEAQGCILSAVQLGDFEITRVFALAFPFTGWLLNHIIIGANILNNWDFTVSRAKNTIRFIETIPTDVPNKEHPYQNYFVGDKYVAVQEVE